MGRTDPGIDSRNADAIRAQPVRFVATAATNLNGHRNLSTKRLESFLILNENTVAYMDFADCGSEAVAPFRANERAGIGASPGRPGPERIDA